MILNIGLMKKINNMDNSMKHEDYLNSRIQSLQQELEKVRSEKLFLASELRFCKMELLRK